MFWPSLGVFSDSVNVCPNVSTNYTAYAILPGCTTTKALSITVYPEPSITVSSDTTICIGSSASLWAIGALNYIWSPSQWLNDSTSNSPLASPTQNTLFEVVGSNIFGCNDTGYVTVEVDSFPNIQIISPVTGFCPNECVSLIAQTNGIVFWPLELSYNDTLTVCPLNTSDYILQSNIGLCYAYDTITLELFPTPTVSVTKDTMVCSGTTIPLQAVGANFYVWSPPLYLNSYTSSNPLSTPYTPITYEVVGTNMYGCKDTAQVNIGIINDSPLRINFEYFVDTCAYEVEFIPTIKDAIKYEWNFGDGSSSRSMQPKHVYSNYTNTYEVSLKVSKPSVCPNYPNVSDSITKEVPVFIDITKRIFPNIFSPNGDAANEIFQPVFGDFCRRYEIEIYNRWGIKIYEIKVDENSENIGWNGKINNTTDAPEGVYYYLINFKDINNDIIGEYKGYLTLTR